MNVMTMQSMQSTLYLESTLLRSPILLFLHISVKSLLTFMILSILASVFFQDFLSSSKSIL